MKSLFFRFLPVISLSVAVAFAATPARALTISNTAILSPGFGDIMSLGFFYLDPSIGQVDTSQTRAYTLQQFDGSLGTLNSVRIDFAQAANARSIILDFNCHLSSFPCIARRTLQLRQQASVNVGSASGMTALRGENATADCDLLGGCSTLLLSQSFNEAIEFTAAADLANFIGSGDFSATATLDLFAGLSGVRESVSLAFGIVGDVIFDGGGSATVTYDYTAATTEIPVPAGAAFLMLGVLALARRRVR